VRSRFKRQLIRLNMKKKWLARTGMEDSRPILFCKRFSYNENTLYSKPKYGTGTPCGTVGLCYRPSNWLDTQSLQYQTCPLTNDHAKRRPRNDRRSTQKVGNDRWPNNRHFLPRRTQTKSTWDAVTYHGDTHSSPAATWRALGSYATILSLPRSCSIWKSRSRTVFWCGDALSALGARPAGRARPRRARSSARRRDLPRHPTVPRAQIDTYLPSSDALLYE